MILPPALRPGDLVAVVAPSGPADEVLVWRGLGWLAERYRLRYDRGILARAGYLAGSDARRREELCAAFADPEVRAVVAVRGGYGLSRIAHGLDWAAFAASPRWIVGFSDITALHVEAARAGVASVHGPNVTGVGRSNAQARASLLAALEEPLALRAYDGLRVLREGAAEGPLFGGNLTMLHACAAAGRLQVPAGAVLLLEDVTEKPYRIDRMLTTLEIGGHLDRIGAVVLGDFTQCDPGPDRTTVDEVLRERLARLGVPIVAGVPIGHEARNDAVVLGAPARVTAAPEGGRFEVGSPSP